VPVTMLITAATSPQQAWPTFLVLRERARPAPVAAGEIWRERPFARLAQTVRQAARYRTSRVPDMHRLYQAGIQTVSRSPRFTPNRRSVSDEGYDCPHLGGHVTAAVGAFASATSRIDSDMCEPLALTLLLWIATTLIVWSASESGLFWVAANLAGLCLGSSQSAGRALVGYLSPADRRAEFFGSGAGSKLSSILGGRLPTAGDWITNAIIVSPCWRPADSSLPALSY